MAAPAPTSFSSRLVVERDRRRSIRIEPPADSPLPARVESLDGRWALDVRPCLNVGLGGVALRLDVDEAYRVRGEEHLRLTLHLAGGCSYELEVRVCYVAELHEGQTRPYQVGLQFMPAPTMCAAVVEIFGYLQELTDFWD